MRIDEIRKLDVSEIYLKLGEFHKELLYISLNKKIGDSSNVMKKKVLKRDVARFLTAINEKKKEEGC